MKSITIIMVFAFTIFVNLFIFTKQAAVQPTCGPNQEYRCSFGCDPHCPELPFHGCDPVLDCMKGCQCKQGFVYDRQRNGACVKEGECLPVKEEVKEAQPFEPNTRISAHGAPGHIGQAVGK